MVDSNPATTIFVKTWAFSFTHFAHAFQETTCRWYIISCVYARESKSSYTGGECYSVVDGLKYSRINSEIYHKQVEFRDRSINYLKMKLKVKIENGHCE